MDCFTALAMTSRGRRELSLALARVAGAPRTPVSLALRPLPRPECANTGTSANKSPKHTVAPDLIRGPAFLARRVGGSWTPAHRPG